MMFCCTCAFSAPVINVPIWLLDNMAELILNPFAPVRSTPAWKLLIEPGPFTTTLSTFGTIIPTLELSCPGPVIENPFMLITVFGPPTMIPSPLQLRFAVRFTTPLTTCPHAALDDDAPGVPPCCCAAAIGISAAIMLKVSRAIIPDARIKDEILQPLIFTLLHSHSKNDVVLVLFMWIYELYLK